MNFAERVRVRKEQQQAEHIAKMERERQLGEKLDTEKLQEKLRKAWERYEPIRINFDKALSHLEQSGLLDLVEELQQTTDGSKIITPEEPDKPRKDGYYLGIPRDAVLKFEFKNVEWGNLYHRPWQENDHHGFEITCNPSGDITIKGSRETVFPYNRWYNNNPAIFEDALADAYINPKFYCYRPPEYPSTRQEGDSIN